MKLKQDFILSRKFKQISAFGADLLVFMLLKSFMRAGEFFKIDRCLSGLLLSLKQVTSKPILYFYNVFRRLTPIISVRKQKQFKKGRGVEYIQVPRIIFWPQAMRLAVKWFYLAIVYERSRAGLKHISLNGYIYDELLKIALKKETRALSHKKEVYSEALQNRAAIKYRW